MWQELHQTPVGLSCATSRGWGPANKSLPVHRKPWTLVTVSAKRILSSSITGQQDVNLSAHLVLRMGFLRYPTGGVEPGIEAMTEIRHSASGEITNLVVQVQTKAGVRLNASNTADRSDADGYWTAGS